MALSCVVFLLFLLPKTLYALREELHSWTNCLNRVRVEDLNQYVIAEQLNGEFKLRTPNQFDVNNGRDLFFPPTCPDGYEVSVDVKMSKRKIGSYYTYVSTKGESFMSLPSIICETLVSCENFEFEGSAKKFLNDLDSFQSSMKKDHQDFHAFLNDFDRKVRNLRGRLNVYHEASEQTEMMMHRIIFVLAAFILLTLMTMIGCNQVHLFAILASSKKVLYYYLGECKFLSDKCNRKFRKVYEVIRSDDESNADGDEDEQKIIEL